MNIYLIGYRGTGKSTVGRLLAQRLRLPFFDADDEIENHAEMSIAEIFQREGESGFRTREARVIEELATGDGCVVALGGGSVLRASNRRAIAAGRKVWLQASAESIYQRVAADQATACRRPDLTDRGELEEIISLLAERNPTYRACADVIIDTEAKSPDQVADEVQNALLPEFS